MTSTGAAWHGSDDHARSGGGAAGALLVAILETSDDAIYGQDAGGTVTTWNRAAERCFGYRGAEIVVLEEAALPVRPAVVAACELLGIDPLYVANEGKFVAIVAPDQANAALAALRAHPLGRDAVKIGDIREEPPGIVVLLTPIGGTRIVDMLVGDPLPRIC